MKPIHQYENITYGPGEGWASDFRAFLMYFGPSELNEASSVSTSIPWTMSSTGGKSALILFAFKVNQC